MEVVAERGNTALVRIDEPSDGVFSQTRGVVVNTRTGVVSTPTLVEHVIARGYWTPFEGDPEPVLALVSSALTAAGFDETKVRRYPKGTRERGKEGGGRFAPKDANATEGGEDEEQSSESRNPETGEEELADRAMLHAPDWLKEPAKDAQEAYYKATRPREAVAMARAWLQEQGHTESAQGIPLNVLNDIGVVEMMNEHFPDGYEFFLSHQMVNDWSLHKEDYRNNWRTPDGKYKPERSLDHDAIQYTFMKDARKPAEGQKPRAVFMAGGSGSGKGSLLGKQVDGIYTGGVIDAPEYAVNINPDDIKEMFDETQILREANDPRWATLAHEESSDVSKMLWDQAEAAGYPYVIDGTGDAAPGKFVDKVRRAERAGWETNVVFVDIPTDEAVRRAKIREQQTGRRVSETAIRDIHHNVTQRHIEWRDEIDNWEVWANDDEKDGGRRVIARRAGGGDIVALDPERYNQMLEKVNG